MYRPEIGYHPYCKVITIKDLKKLKRGRWDGSMKRKVVLETSLLGRSFPDIKLIFAKKLSNKLNSDEGLLNA